MSTVEYAIGTIAAAAFGAILYTVITGDSIVSALTNVINRALNTNVLGDEAGGVTVEAAFAIAALVVVLMLCVSGLMAVSMQVRCVDAAREAARLSARGDDSSASDAARARPDGAAVQLRRDGGFVVATVTTRLALLPGVIVAAQAVAAVEPGLR